MHWKVSGNVSGNQNEDPICMKGTTYNDDENKGFWFVQDDCYDFVSSIGMVYFWCLSKTADVVNVVSHKLLSIRLSISEGPQITQG